MIHIIRRKGGRTRNIEMTEGEPLKLIMLFTFPLLVQYIIGQTYSLADSMVVGRYLGEDAFATIGSVGAGITLVSHLTSGAAVGFGISISRFYGSKDEAALCRCMANALNLGVIISGVLGALSLVSLDWLLDILHTPDNIYSMSKAYATVIFAGLPISLLYNIVLTALRNVGDSKITVYISLSVGILNVPMNIVFIKLFHTGPEGTAYATVLVQLIGLVVSYLYMIKNYTSLRVTRRDFIPDPAICRNMLANAIPVSLQYCSIAVGTMYMQSIVNSFGSTVVAAYAAGSKLEPLVTAPMHNVGTAILVYCGQNHGAKKYERIYKGVRVGFWIMVVLTLFATGVSFLLGDGIAKLFLEDPSAELLSYTKLYVFTTSFFYFPLALIPLYRSALQGVEQRFIPMLSSFVEIICRVGTILILKNYIGFWSICFASPAAWASAAIILTTTYYVWRWKAKKAKA